MGTPAELESVIRSRQSRRSPCPSSVAREPRRAGLQFLKSEALRLVSARHIGRRLETAVNRTAEVLQKLRTLHTLQPLLRVRHNLVATRSQDVRRQPVVATSHHTVARFQMQVIAAMQRLLAVSRNIGSEMILIGRLVVREARVAIEPVSTVLHRQVGNQVPNVSMRSNACSTPFSKSALTASYSFLCS